MTESPSTDQLFISKLTDIVLANLNNPSFGVKELARESGFSLYTLSRKLNSINKKTINQFIREVRLQKSLEMLKDGSLTATEIAYKVGFSSPAYFNTCFSDYFGFPPGHLKKGNSSDSRENIGHAINRAVPGGSKKRRLIVIYPFALLILILAFLFIDQGRLINFRWNGLTSIRSSAKRISVVVMPFLNMSNDSTLNYLNEWIPISTTSYLSNFSDYLEVRQTESVYKMIKGHGLTIDALMTPSLASSISTRLDANIEISGSLIKTGETVIVNTNIVNSKTREVLKSFRETGNSDKINQKIDTLSTRIKDFLIVSILKRELSPDIQHFISTNSSDALKHYMLGRNAFKNMDYNRTDEECLKALKADPDFTSAYLLLIISYARNGLGDSSVIYCHTLYNKREQMTLQEKLNTEFVYSMFLKTPYDCINYDKQLLQLDDQQPGVHFTLAYYYRSTNQSDKAITEYEKSLKIYKKWGIRPESAENYTYLGDAYHALKNYKKEEKLYKKASVDFPNDLRIIDNEIKLSLALKDTSSVRKNLNNFVTLSRENSVSDFTLAIELASAYMLENYHEKAEEYIQMALKLPPDNLSTLTNFAWFLIDKDLDVNGGLKLVQKALEVKPDNFNNLDSKGWGLFKIGKYKESLYFLHKADSLNPNKNDTIISLHISAVHKAMQGQEKNKNLVEYSNKTISR